MPFYNNITVIISVKVSYVKKVSHFYACKFLLRHVAYIETLNTGKIGKKYIAMALLSPPHKKYHAI